MDITISDDESSWVKNLEETFSAHCAIVNDLFSWENVMPSREAWRARLGRLSSTPSLRPWRNWTPKPRLLDSVSSTKFTSWN